MRSPEGDDRTLLSRIPSTLTCEKKACESVVYSDREESFATITNRAQPIIKCAAVRKYSHVWSLVWQATTSARQSRQHPRREMDRRRTKIPYRSLAMGFIGCWLVDAMHHQSCLSELKRGEEQGKKGGTWATILVANDPQTHVTTSIKRNNAKTCRKACKTTRSIDVGKVYYNGLEVHEEPNPNLR
jgi:hypothetical protein